MGIYKRMPGAKPKVVNEFATLLDKGHHFFEKKWKKVLMGLGVAVFAIILALSVFQYKSGRNKMAAELLYQAAKLAEGSDEAVAAFGKVIESYPRSLAAENARLALGNIWLARGDYPKAEDALLPLESAKTNLTKVIGLHSLAAVRSAKGDLKGAAEKYLQAFDYSDNPVKGFSYFNAALAYYNAGNIDGARKIFEELADEKSQFTTPELIEKSKEQLIWMSAQK
ncbi:MAG: tetratricopeptide repeat protein [Deltaproteobacteria bacterium]|nr:tetratricopeptide repeat protein [Deltaproteobacteria bacterium]